MSFRILGTGRSVPETLLTSDDLAARLAVTPEWIQQRCGIHARRISDPDRCTSDYAAEACERAIESSGLDRRDIDLLVLATSTPDQPLPPTVCRLQGLLGLPTTAVFDIGATCAGFLYGLRLANGLIRSGDIRHALIVASELPTRHTDYTDASTSIVFSDGAGAVVVGTGDGDSYVLAADWGADGRHWEASTIRGGGTRVPYGSPSFVPHDRFVYMSGGTIYKLAVRQMADAAQRVIDRASLTVDDVDLVIPHQANLRIVEGVLDRFPVDRSKVYVNLGPQGNCISATIPVALDECARSGRLKRGDIVLLTSVGIGVIWAAMLLRW